METRFFCEKCGSDVSLDTEACPFCGERFDAVRCPECTFIGKPAEFTEGCPRCGFMNPGQEMTPPPQKKAGKKRKKRPYTFKQNFPPAVYYSVIVVFLLALVVLVYLLVRE